MVSQEDKLKKLLTLAFDPGAADGESANAAVAAVRHARRERLGLADVVELLGAERRLPPPAPAEPPAAVRVVMPFGKHEGRTLGEIAERAPGYLRWCVRNFEGKPELVSAMRATLYWYDLEGEE